MNTNEKVISLSLPGVLLLLLLSLTAYQCKSDNDARSENIINHEASWQEARHLEFRASQELTDRDAPLTPGNYSRAYGYALEALAINQKSDRSSAKAMSLVLQDELRRKVNKEIWRSPTPGKESHYGVAFHPNGTLMATTTSSGTIRLWDIAKGVEKSSAKKHGSVAIDALFIDDQRIASAGIDGTISIWNINTLKTEQIFRVSKTGVLCLALSPDRQLLASGSQDSNIRIFDLASGKIAKQFQGHTGPVLALQFTADGKKLISSSRDGNVFIWNMLTAIKESSLPQQNGSVPTLALSPDNRLLAIAANSGQMLIWDIEENMIQSTLSSNSNVTDLVFLPNGENLLVGTEKGELQKWSVNSGEKATSAISHAAKIRSIASNNGRIAVTSEDKTISLWTYDLQQVARLSGHHRDVLSVAVSPDGETVATGAFDKSIRIWDAASGTEKIVLTGHTAEILDLQFSADSRLLLSSSADHSLRLWDIGSQICIQTINMHTGQVYALAAHHRSNRFASGSNDKSAIIWKLINGKLQQEKKIDEHNSPVVALAFSEDGTKMHTASLENSLRVFDIQSGRMQLKKSSIPVDFWYSQFSPNAELFATLLSDTLVQLYDLRGASIKKTSQFRGNSQIRSLEFDRHSTRLAIGDIDGTITLIETAGQEIESFKAHHRVIWDFAFHPTDEMKMFSGGRDHSATFWNLSEQKPLASQPFPANIRMLHGSYVDEENRLIIAASSMDSLHWLDAQTGESTKSMAENELLHSLYFFASPSRFVAYGNDGTITVLELPDGRKRLIRADNDAVNVQLSSDGSMLAICRQSGEFKLLNAQNGDSLFAYPLPALVRKIAFSADATLVAADCADGNIYVFDIASKSQIEQFVCPAAGGSELAFSPDNRYLAYSNDRATVVLRELKTQKEARWLNESEKPLGMLRFAPKGNLLAISRKWASSDLELWDWQRELLLATIPLDEKEQLREMMFSNDGEMLYYRLANKTTQSVDLRLLQDYLQHGSRSEILKIERDRITTKFGFRFKDGELLPGKRKRVLVGQ
ncbi:MAG: PQQ-binding-like beta-propeller repeat protein [Calditrichia bacterium]